MALVNAVVVANEGLQERVRIRNDFVCTSSTHATKVHSGSPQYLVKCVLFYTSGIMADIDDKNYHQFITNKSSKEEIFRFST